jgi:hypothetical protein
MKLVTLTAVFDVTYGNKFDLVKMHRADGEGAVAFVGRTGGSNGVSAYVERVPEVEPYPAGCITVALGGAVLASFVQTRPFYTAQNVAVLRPRESLSLPQLLYYCTAIKANRFRYSAFGREANRTLRSLAVPAPNELPRWIEDATARTSKDLEHGLQLFGALDEVRSAASTHADGQAALATVEELFSINYGHSLELNALEPRDNGVAFVSRTTRNNGISARVSPVEGTLPERSGALTVALSGSPMATFLQEEPFYTAYHVAVLRPKLPMSRNVLLYYAACLTANRFRYSYGRQANRTLAKLRLPALVSVPMWVDGAFDRVAQQQLALLTGRSAV